MSAGDIVARIKSEAISSAAQCKYCKNCRYSWIHPEAESGFCKIAHDPDQPSFSPKAVNEFDSCPKWEKK